MRKVGIITMYHNSENYGGLAQAYALQKVVEKEGFDAELISYVKLYKNRTSIARKCQGALKKLKNKVLIYVGNTLYKKRNLENLKRRSEAFKISREAIPHSQVYSTDTIDEIKDIYDLFISGSDQIWKPGIVDKGYVFSFLNETHNIISYSSSTAVKVFPESFNLFMKENLSKYSWISVREKNAKMHLEKILGRNIDVVVDPTMLISPKEWSDYASIKHIDGKYIFAYMLGESVEQRRIIKRFAKKHSLSIVTLPHLGKNIRLCDLKFGDVNLYDVVLSDFLGLIKNAEYVITDSFHATVFSIIFNTKFWVFERTVYNPNDNMNDRIETLLEMLSLDERFLINDQAKILFDDEDTIDFELSNKLLEKYSKESLEKLRFALNRK